VHPKAPNVISATDGNSPGAASDPPTTALEGDAATEASTAQVATTVKSLRCT
jgi:hypothetical protein